MGRPRVLLVDDHALILDAFKKLLEPEFDVIASVSNGTTAIQVGKDLAPDVIVLDLGLPDMNLLDAGPKLKKALPNAKLIVMTMNENSKIAGRALKQWASGYLLKKSAASELVIAIREALRGRKYVTPATQRNVQEDFLRHPEFDHSKGLTLRQREVLRLLAEGRTMREIAEILNVTPRTVAFHKYKIKEEFGLKTNSDLVKLALRERV